MHFLFVVSIFGFQTFCTNLACKFGYIGDINQSHYTQKNIVPTFQGHFILSIVSCKFIAQRKNSQPMDQNGIIWTKIQFYDSIILLFDDYFQRTYKIPNPLQLYPTQTSSSSIILILLTKEAILKHAFQGFQQSLQ